MKGSREEEITLPHLPTPEHTASPEPVSPSLGPSSSHAEHLRSGFANTINNVLCSQVLPPPPESIPNSPDEFLKCFELHEQNMLSFLNKIRDGEYELVGLTASDIQPMR